LLLSLETFGLGLLREAASLGGEGAGFLPHSVGGFTTLQFSLSPQLEGLSAKLLALLGGNPFAGGGGLPGEGACLAFQCSCRVAFGSCLLASHPSGFGLQLAHLKSHRRTFCIRYARFPCRRFSQPPGGIGALAFGRSSLLGGGWRRRGGGDR